MILRRLTRHMKSENWTAAAIEFVLVILGVFLGILAANWNEERLEKRETRQLLGQLDEELTAFVRYIDALGSYYASVKTYSDRAEAAWDDSGDIDDSQFIIAAYQASQINGVGNDGAVWGTIFGAENLRDIDDPVIRQTLARVMTYDFDLVSISSVATRYREEVRKVIPDDMQAAIRAKCGDRLAGAALVLPARCDLRFDPEQARRTAAALRARPELAAELNWHQAAVANQQTNLAALRRLSDTLANRIGPPSEKKA